MLEALANKKPEDEAKEKADPNFICAACGLPITGHYYEDDEAEAEDEGEEAEGEDGAAAAPAAANKWASAVDKLKKTPKLHIECWEQRNTCLFCAKQVDSAFFQLKEGRLHEEFAQLLAEAEEILPTLQVSHVEARARSLAARPSSPLCRCPGDGGM